MPADASSFVSSIHDAFTASPLASAIVVAMSVGLITLLVVYATSSTRRERREKTRLARRLFEERAGQLKITREQRALLERMARYLKDPTEIHRVVTDEVSFNAAAHRIREREGIEAQVIASLRIALGYTMEGGDRSPHSSASIPEGATVLIARNKYRRPSKAKVLAPNAESFDVTMADEDARMPPGAAVDVYFQSNAGVFTFHTTVLHERGTRISLAHSEELKKYQKRKYYRKRVDLAVRVYPFDEDIVLMSRFREVGGGGASLMNPEKHFHVGDNVELRFKPEGSDEIRVTGTIVRVSDSGKVLHVNYEHIRDGLRDRIYHAIFRPPKDERDAMKRATE